MKKTQKKDAGRNIKKSIVSFLSILLVITLGLGGYFTIVYMTEGLSVKAAEYYGDRSFKDYEMLSSTGVTGSDISKIKSVEGVVDAEGVIRADGVAAQGSVRTNVTVLSETEHISVPEVTEGKKPVSPDECMIGEDFAEKSGFRTGDKIEIRLSGLAMEDPLLEHTFTITGLMHHPDYIRRSSVNTVVLPMVAYDPEVTDGLFTNAFVLIREPQGADIFSDAFFKKTSDITAALNDLIPVLEKDGVERIRADMRALIDEEWDKATEQLNDAESEINSNEEKLNSELGKARDKLNDAENELSSEVAKGEKEIKEAQKKLDSEVAKGEKEIKDAQKKLDSEVAKGKKKISDGEKALKKAKKELAENKKKLKEAKKALNGEDPEELIKKTDDAIEMIERIQELDTDGKIDEAFVPTRDFIIDHEKEIIDLKKSVDDPDVSQDELKIILEGLGCETDLIEPVLKVLKELSADELKDIIQLLKDNPDVESLDDLKEALANVKNDLQKIIDAEAGIKEAEKKISKGEKDLAGGKKELSSEKKKGQAKIDSGKKELNSEKKKGQAKIDSGKEELASEKEKGEKKIKKGWAQYYADKAHYEGQIADARTELEGKRTEAQEKYDEARENIGDVESHWVVLDRNANSGYVDISSNLKGMSKAGTVFGILFILITAIVCFSTLAIIIEDQKKLVGTVKAFGFLKREILGKYLVFGAGASVLGDIIGILVALCISNLIQKKYAETAMYQFAQARSVITPLSTVLICLGMILVCIIATLFACSDIMKFPASMLMQGGKPPKKKQKKKVSSHKRSGSLYSRLIIRNMLDDKARVVITVVVVAFSVFLIGTGITIKYAFDGMTEKELNEIYLYDTRMDFIGDDPAGKTDELEKVFRKHGVDFLPATYESHLYDWDGRLDAASLLCADSDKIGKYLAVKDMDTDELKPLPEDGLLVQNRMEESYGMEKGKTLPVLNDSLRSHDAVVKGKFRNYLGRMIVTSPAGYRKIFGEKNKQNCYYLILNGADYDKLIDELKNITSDISFESKDDFMAGYNGITSLYNIIVIITTVTALIMSVMILTNMANILLKRKKTELTVMRVNGFTVKETKGYLTKETVITTTAGVIIGVLLGALVDPLIIRLIELPDAMFVRSFQPVAWIVAVIVEIIFAVVIYSISFNKVKKLNLRDIA